MDLNNGRIGDGPLDGGAEEGPVGAMMEGANITLSITDEAGRSIGVKAVFNDLELLRRDPLGAVKAALVAVTEASVKCILDNNLFRHGG